MEGSEENPYCYGVEAKGVDVNRLDLTYSWFPSRNLKLLLLTAYNRFTGLIIIIRS